MAIQTLTVDGEGAGTSGWQAEGGAYTRLQSDDGDTTRFYSPTPGDIRQFTLTNTSGLSGATINSLTIYCKTRSLDPVSNTFKIGVRSGGTNYWGSTKDTVSSTSYILFSETWTTDPATGSAWTVSALDAVQGGAEKGNLAGMGWTYSYAEVDYTPGGGGGTTYNRSVYDAMNVSEAVRRTFTIARKQADSLSGTDANRRVFASTRTRIDNTTVQDSPKRQVSSARKQADSTQVTDSPKRQMSYGRKQADATSTTDSIRRQVSFGRKQADNTSTTDNNKRVHASSRKNTDTTSVVDSPKRTLSYVRRRSDETIVTDVLNSVKLSIIQAFVTDNVGLTDFSRRTITYSKKVFDGVNIADYLKRVASAAVKVVDNAGVSESVARRQVVNRLKTDSANISDYISYVISFPTNNDGSPGPTIDSIVLRPEPYLDPNTTIVYEMTGKLYDTHTPYDKHIPYYSAISSDFAPTVAEVSEF